MIQSISIPSYNDVSVRVYLKTSYSSNNDEHQLLRHCVIHVQVCTVHSHVPIVVNLSGL